MVEDEAVDIGGGGGGSSGGDGEGSITHPFYAPQCIGTNSQRYSLPTSGKYLARVDIFKDETLSTEVESC